MCDPVVFVHFQCGIDPRTSGMDCDVIDVNSAPDESAKESSYFHVHGSHLYVSLAWSFSFSLLWPTLLTCSGRTSSTATTFIQNIGRVVVWKIHFRLPSFAPVEINPYFKYNSLLAIERSFPFVVVVGPSSSTSGLLKFYSDKHLHKNE